MNYPVQEPGISLIELKQRYQEVKSGSYFCWWFDKAQFGYNIGCNTYNYLGSILSRDGKAILSIDDYKHSTKIHMEVIGDWSRITPERCLQIIRENVEFLEDLEASQEVGQLSLF
jgi:hypothetical protein